MSLTTYQAANQWRTELADQSVIGNAQVAKLQREADEVGETVVLLALNSRFLGGAVFRYLTNWVDGLVRRQIRPGRYMDETQERIMTTKESAI